MLLRCVRAVARCCGIRSCGRTPMQGACALSSNSNRVWQCKQVNEPHLLGRQHERSKPVTSAVTPVETHTNWGRLLVPSQHKCCAQQHLLQQLRRASGKDDSIAGSSSLPWTRCTADDVIHTQDHLSCLCCAQQHLQQEHGMAGGVRLALAPR